MPMRTCTRVRAYAGVRVSFTGFTICTFENRRQVPEHDYTPYANNVRSHAHLHARGKAPTSYRHSLGNFFVFTFRAAFVRPSRCAELLVSKGRQKEDGG